jgi:predicted nucleotidyltransferase component of viral defense system
MISNEQINDIAERRQIDTFTVVREYIQVSFLSALYSRKESREVFFKGGTAIHLLFKAPRYSEDLDFSTSLPRSEIGALLNGAVMTV